MSSVKFLLDNDVRHLDSCFPLKSALQLEDVGLQCSSDDDEIVAAASVAKLVIVTNNRRHFQSEVRSRVAQTSKKPRGCTQVHGLVIVLPSEAIKQERALNRASKQMKYDGRAIGWKEVNDLCLEVIIEESGNAKLTKLPRCPHCDFHDD